MATAAMNKQFSAEYDALITADVYDGQEKIASPGDTVEVGGVARGHKTLCRIAGRLYWIENSAWDVR